MTGKLSTIRTRHQRHDLTGEFRYGGIGQIVLACLFALTWLSDTFLFNYTTFLNDLLPLAVRIPLGLPVLLFSGYLAKEGLRIIFGETRQQPAVIRKGVYAIVRHPIYLSEILFYLGLLFLSVSLAAAVVWIFGVGFLHFISRYEEKLLLRRFGQEYAQYMQEVGMWIPWLGKIFPFRKSE